MIIYLTLIALINIFVIIFIVHYKNKKINELNKSYQKLLNQKKSSEIKLGQISEQIAPFLQNFPYDPKNVKFLGQPIDLISFEDDKVVFIEIKTGNSQLSEKQRQIKQLINNKKIFWEEFRISGNALQLKNNQSKTDEDKTIT